MAESVLVMALFVLVVMAVLQIGLAVYVRNSLVQCAVEGARYGGRADVTEQEGAARAAELAAGFLGAGRRDAVSATTVRVRGAALVEVTITTSLPVIGLVGPAGSMTVHGRSFEEAQ